MDQIEFDPKAFGLPARYVSNADVGCAETLDPAPRMMLKKFIGDTRPKVVRLSDIYRVKQPVVEAGEHIHPRPIGKGREDRVIVKLVLDAALPTPINDV